MDMEGQELNRNTQEKGRARRSEKGREGKRKAKATTNSNVLIKAKKAK